MKFNLVKSIVTENVAKL